MASSKTPEFVFRGTTEGYPGGKNSIEMPYTCTSTHPVKALWFALECFHQNPGTACVYIAQMHDLDHLGFIYNHFYSLEDEIGFPVNPTAFYQQCLGLISVPDFQKILEDHGLSAYEVVRKENLTWFCKETPRIRAATVRSIVKYALQVCKKITKL